MADSGQQAREGRMDTAPPPRSPIQSPRSIGSPRSVGSPRSLPSPRFVFSLGYAKLPQLHAPMCATLAALLKRVQVIGPALDAERGRFRKAGIQALCAMQLALDKARSLLHYCAESSKLYLAIKGESMLARFEEVKEGLESSLRRIAVLVSQELATQIAELQGELSQTRFALDPVEKQIGAEIISLLLQKQKGAQYENPQAEQETFGQVATRLGLVSADAILVEKRALKRLLEKARYEEDRRKEAVTLHILQLMKKFNNVLRTENDDLAGGGGWPVSDRGWGSGKLSVSGGGESEPDRTPSPRTAVGHLHCAECRCPELAFASAAGEAGLDDAGGGDCGSPTTPRTPRTPLAPEELRCPISLQLMSEPVIVASGQTYERVCIEKWFQEGHVTCPKTRQTLAHLNLTPNYCVKGLIASWCEAHGIAVPDAPSPPPSPVTSWRWELFSASELVKVGSGEQLKDARVVPVDDLPEEDATGGAAAAPGGKVPPGDAAGRPERNCEDASSGGDAQPGPSPAADQRAAPPEVPEEQWVNRFEELVADLTEGSLQQRCLAAEEVRVLAKTNAKARSRLGDGGAIPALVELLRAAVDADEQTAQETGALALLNVAISDDRNKAAVVAAGAVPLFVELLKAGASRACKEAAVAALLTLSCLNENKACIGASGAIPLLVQLLISGSNQGRKDALTTLYNLTIFLGNRPRVVRAGAIPILVHLLSLRKVDLLEKIVALLYNLASIEEGRATVAKTEGGIAVLAEILETGSAREKEHAAATLLLLCTSSAQHSQLVLREGVIPALVSLSIGGNPRGQDKAQKLLQHFREQRQKEAVLSHSAPLSMGTGPAGGSSGENSAAAAAAESPPAPAGAGAAAAAATVGKGDKKEGGGRKFGKSRSGSLGFIWKARVALPLYQC